MEKAGGGAEGEAGAGVREGVEWCGGVGDAISTVGTERSVAVGTWRRDASRE